MPRKNLPIIECGCGCGQTGVSRARGWIMPCYLRWWRAGKPTSGPPAPPRQERIEEYLWLRSQGVEVEEAARRLGVTLRTGLSYEQAQVTS